MAKNTDTRFFTVSQLWQSLAITFVAVGTVFFAVTFHTHSTTSNNSSAPAPVTAATTSQSAAAVATATIPSTPFGTMRITGRAAIVEDLSNGHVLYSQNADAHLPLASLTKLLTMYAAQDALQPDSIVTISSSSLAQDGEYGFQEGEEFAYKDISRLALVASSNDAAEAIAEASAAARGETVSQFVTEAVQSAGLSNTTATNGTGLDVDASEAGAYGTARDIAKLASEFVAKSPSLAKSTTAPSVTIYSLTGIPHTLPNTNPDVSSMTGLLLSKTGYTDLAGGNLVTVFDAGIGHPIAVVVLGSTVAGRFTDVEKLMSATSAEFALNKAP